MTTPTPQTVEEYIGQFKKAVPDMDTSNAGFNSVTMYQSCGFQCAKNKTIMFLEETLTEYGEAMREEGRSEQEVSIAKLVQTAKQHFLEQNGYDEGMIILDNICIKSGLTKKSRERKLFENAGKAIPLSEALVSRNRKFKAIRNQK